MKQSLFAEIEEFVGKLPQMRQQLSDQQLLDSCQSHLTAFVALVKEASVALEPDPPKPAPAAAPTQTQSQ